MITLAPPAFCLPGVGCPADITGSLAHAAASAVLDAVGRSLTGAADWLVTHVTGLVGTTTRPDFEARWFDREAALMGRVVLMVVLPILMAATIGPVLRQDGRRLARVWGVGLPVAVLAGAAGSQLAGLALTVTDGLCAVFTGPHSQYLASQMTGAMVNPYVSGSPLFVQMVLAGLTVAGTVLVWLELMVRDAAVYVATFFMPLALVAYVWPATASFARRAVEILVSLILSKFVIVASLSLGLAALQTSGIDRTMAGAAILLLAGFAPFTLMRLAPVVEAAAISHLEGVSRRPLRAAASAGATATGIRANPVVSYLMAGRGGAGAPTGPTAVAAQGVPERGADFVVAQAGGSPRRPGPTAGASGG